MLVNVENDEKLVKFSDIPVNAQFYYCNDRFIKIPEVCIRTRCYNAAYYTQHNVLAYLDNNTKCHLIDSLKFKELKFGDVFTISGLPQKLFFMKMNVNIVENLYNAVSLNDGIKRFFDDDCDVIKQDVILVRNES